MPNFPFRVLHPVCRSRASFDKLRAKLLNLSQLLFSGRRQGITQFGDMVVNCAWMHVVATTGRSLRRKVLGDEAELLVTQIGYQWRMYTTRSGMFEIEVGRKRGKLFLKGDWSGFVNSNEICRGYKLCFLHDYNNVVRVTIFDKHGHEVYEPGLGFLIKYDENKILHRIPQRSTEMFRQRNYNCNTLGLFVIGDDTFTVSVVEDDVGFAIGEGLHRIANSLRVDSGAVFWIDRWDNMEWHLRAFDRNGNVWRCGKEEFEETDYEDETDESTEVSSEGSGTP